MKNNCDKNCLPESMSAGDIARSTLIQAGLDMFGQHGFTGVSVRQICQQAKMNVASINYHFGGKDGLYVAVADYIAQQIYQHMQASLAPAMAFVEEGGSDTDQALELLLNIIGATVDFLVPDSKEKQRWARFISRFQMGEQAPEHGLYKSAMNDITIQLIGIIRGEPNAELENAIYAQAFFGQILVFRVSRLTSKAALQVTAFGRQETELIKQVIFNNVRNSLVAE